MTQTRRPQPRSYTLTLAGLELARHDAPPLASHKDIRPLVTLTDKGKQAAAEKEGGK